MRKIVITGGPCSGKTSLISELEKRGNFVVHEAALQLIEQENKKSDDQKRIYPWTNYQEFNNRLFLLQKELEDNILKFSEDPKSSAANTEAAYLDRSFIDSIAYLSIRGLPIPVELETAIKKAEYSLFFILEMLPEKFWADTGGRPARMQKYSDGQKLHEEIQKIYLSYGIKLIKVPVMGIVERADFIEGIVAQNKMRETITMDDSITLYNERYQDHYHSKSGAVGESFEKFVKPANISGRKEMRLLDIGFGIGYTCAAAIEEFFGDGKDKNSRKMELISLEKDQVVLKEVKMLSPRLKYFEKIKMLSDNPLLEFEDENLKMKIIIGDATTTIKDLADNYFDVVFADGFSPAKNPELWTLEFFKDVFSKTKKGGVLTTYSYARSVRENLAAAGFVVKDGPVIGRRSPSIVAVKK